MAEPWLLVPPGELVATGEDIRLDEDEARHAASVLRCHAGDRVVLADGAGVTAAAVLAECSRSGVVASIEEVREAGQRGVGVSLFAGVLHTRAMDLVVQKAVEVGVLRLEPVVCGRSQGGVAGAARRLEHWRRVARQAVKQCRRPWMMEVGEARVLEFILPTLTAGVVAEPEGRPLQDIPLERCSSLLVGPEGGLTDAERSMMEGRGWVGLELGPHVLRAETACIVGSAVLGMRLRSGGATLPRHE